jgi:hypothetical protein
MSVRRAQREVSSREYAEWMAFYVLEAEEQDPDGHAPSPQRLAAKMAAFADRGKAS